VGVRGLTTDPVRVQQAAQVGHASLTAALARAMGGSRTDAA